MDQYGANVDVNDGCAVGHRGGPADSRVLFIASQEYAQGG